ncbi:MAG TPA: ADP/ATP-dependent (S)-NAD(P)H-hydrate dehydratase, partial [Albitalea sp.]|nr:ADP/ATP-dependent (S)-NAD(P)H-hydrate dehydratase [Albitalea sp.]
MDTPVAIDEGLLRGWPLPLPDAAGDKEARGRTLIVAGSRQMPGAVLLAGTAALRAGAGKLMIASVAGIASDLAIAIPEARVIALPETDGGGLSGAGAAQLAAIVHKIDAVLIGPGLLDEDAGHAFVRELLPMFAARPIVLDALAMGVVGSLPRFAQPVLLTPHAGEMAHLSGEDKQAVAADPLVAATRAAQRWNAVVALKGALTVI